MKKYQIIYIAYLMQLTVKDSVLGKRTHVTITTLWFKLNI